MASLLEGSAFVTGASSGIGQQTAYALAKHGITKLALADINLDGLTQTANTLRERFPHLAADDDNNSVLTLQVDVSDAGQIKTAIGKTVERFGRLDVAVNNAGIRGDSVQSHELGEENWLKVMSVNLNGVFWCQKEELAVMVGQEDLGPRRGRGSIINVGSVYSVLGPRAPIHQTAYAAAKHGVLGMTKADANSYAGSNIRINAVCPGFVKTAILGGAESGIDVPGHPLYDYVSGTPLGRLAEVEEVADCIVFLASSMSSYVNGAGLMMDGGFSVS